MEEGRDQLPIGGENAMRGLQPESKHRGKRGPAPAESPRNAK